MCVQLEHRPPQGEAVSYIVNLSPVGLVGELVFGLVVWWMRQTYLCNTKYRPPFPSKRGTPKRGAQDGCLFIHPPSVFRFLK